MRHLIRWWNWLRGYGYDWIDTPGTPAGGYIQPRPGTCPSAVLNDWSAKACKLAGYCGCDEVSIRTTSASSERQRALGPDD